MVMDDGLYAGVITVNRSALADGKIQSIIIT